MPRVSEISPDSGSPEAREIFAEGMRQLGAVTNFGRVMLHTPAAYKAWLMANKGVRMQYLKEDPEFLCVEQCVVIKTSMLNGSAYCLGHNTGLAKEVGFTEAHFDAIRGDYRSSPLLTDAQKTAIRWAEQVTHLKARDDEALFQEMRKHFTDRQIVELTVLIGMWNWSNRFTEALHIELEPEELRIKFHPRREPAKA
jgi:alkylhydroperoxidase family enzyme